MNISNFRTAGKSALAALTLSFASLGALPAHAELTAAAKQEIDYLLAFVGNSGCEFYRNGSWYDGKKGASHMSDKYNYLIGSNMIQATSEFIDKAATQSSLSGMAYKVRCNGGEPIASAKWMNEELVRYRASARPAAMQVSARPVSAGTASAPVTGTSAVKVN